MKVILVDAVDTFVTENEGIYQPLYDLLEGYPNEKIILTNADDEQISTFGLDEMPYEVFTLKHQPNKTDPVYFKTFLSEYGLGADEVLYFEHNAEAVESARSIGIATYHYDSEKRDLEALKAFIDGCLEY